MGPRWIVLLALVATGCSLSPVATTATPTGPADWFLSVNLAGGWADGAEVHGIDDSAAAVVAAVSALPSPPVALFLSEACESQATSIAAGLGDGWQAFFVPTWPGHSDCFPAPGADAGRAGNAVVVDDPAAAPFTIPSCHDPGVAADGCLPNWEPPAEQRRAACVRSGRVLCSVHLDPVEWDRHGEQLAAVARITSGLAAEHGEVVVGGDFNVGIEAVERAFDDVGVVAFTDVAGGRRLPTYPAKRPDRDLDHVVLLSSSPGRSAGARTIDLGRCRSTWRKDGRCSDHLVLLAGLSAG